MKKNLTVKIFAILALLGIIIGIIGTGILFVFEGGGSSVTDIELTPEQIQELIERQEQTGTGDVIDNSVIEVLGTSENGEVVEATTEIEGEAGEQIDAQ